MAVTYDVRTVALTIDMPIKWVDNVLSHHRLPGVSGGRQGVLRQVSPNGLLAIEITRMLSVEVRLPQSDAARAATLALELRAGDDARVPIGAGVVLVLPLADIEARLRVRIVEAVESTPRIPRGRPPTRTRRVDP